MRNSPDPSIHRQREKQIFDHVERLLEDHRLRLETSAGRQSAPSLQHDIRKEDHEVDLIRTMADLGVFDRDIQAAMPIGRELTVTLTRIRFLFFESVVASLKVLSLAPVRDLLTGRPAQPASIDALTAALAGFRQNDDRIPSTVIVLSTSGFSPEAHRLAAHSANRTVILAEPNDAGGWIITGPPQAQPILDMLDPELDADKRARVRAEIQRRAADLLSSGLSATRIASAMQLPIQLVEDELESYSEQSPGLVARRLQGNVVLFREGNSPVSSPDTTGGSSMPFIQRLRALFTGKADNQKKIGLLSERRAALCVQRDQAYEEMGVLETKETELRTQFQASTSALTKRRITSQLVQIRKDLERRQQLLGMLNQQINVLSTHLHNIELVQQGQSAQLPNSEELAGDAAAAEEAIAQLQADNELADSVATTGPAGLSDEEQALYEELERESAAKTPAPQPQAATKTPAPAEPAKSVRATPPPLPPEKQRGQAEPG